MSYKYESVVNVIGHINPDTDSVCSAIAYANLSRRVPEKNISRRERDRSMQKRSLC